MNAGMAYSLESLFGPPSELIDVNAFLQAASDSSTSSSDLPHLADFISASRGFHQLSEEEKNVITTECSVTDLKDSLHDTWNDPTLSALVLKEHEHTISTLHSTTKPPKSGSRKHLPDPDSLPQEAAALQMDLNAVKLSSWKLQPDSALFMRTSINSDYNALRNVLSAGPSAAPDTQQAVITFAVHNRVSWGPSYVLRSSQHCLLSSQTLQDLCGVIPCPSNNSPSERIESGTASGYEKTSVPDEGCVICIENVAYCDSHGEMDYSDKVLQHLEKVSKKPSHFIKKAPAMLADTSLSSLSLRISEPYWMLHHGNCEHFIVVDQIRLRHPSDPSCGYPLTTQLTPILLDLCRACGKVPAVWSIVGDTRLGESPCIMCRTCWNNMGDPEDAKVIIVPLPSYSLG